MTIEIRNLVTNEVIAGPYSTNASAKRAFSSRGLLPDQAVITDTEWRERERKREKLINVEEFGLVAIPDHFLHVSQKSTDLELMVSFTENETKGQRNLQKAGTKIGKYLVAYYPTLSQAMIKDLSAAITAKYLDLGIKFASTRTEIKWVYDHSRQSASSCMTHSMEQYNSRPVHPTEAYEGPDLKIAYLTDSTGKNVVARTLVWPEKKRYSRVYGTNAGKLQALLGAMGYASGSMAGARMNMILRPGFKPENHPGMMQIVIPYLDNHGIAHFNGEYVVIGEDPKYQYENFSAGTSGYAEFYSYFSVLSNKKVGRREVFNVIHPRTGASMIIHTDEAKGNTERHGDYWYLTTGMDEKCFITGGDGRTYPRHYAENNMRTCAVNGKYYPTNLMRRLQRGGYVCMAEFYGIFAVCEINGGAYPRTDMILMAHGAYWSRDAFLGYGTTLPDGRKIPVVQLAKYESEQKAA